jgi:hypothetical protein
MSSVPKILNIFFGFIGQENIIISKNKQKILKMLLFQTKLNILLLNLQLSSICMDIAGKKFLPNERQSATKIKMPACRKQGFI